MVTIWKGVVSMDVIIVIGNLKGCFRFRDNNGGSRTKLRVKINAVAKVASTTPLLSCGQERIVVQWR